MDSPPEAPASSNTPTPTSTVKPFEQHAVSLQPWELAALKVSAGWAAGREVSESDFQTAVDAMRGEVIK